LNICRGMLRASGRTEFKSPYSLSSLAPRVTIDSTRRNCRSLMRLSCNKASITRGSLEGMTPAKPSLWRARRDNHGSPRKIVRLMSSPPSGRRRAARGLCTATPELCGLDMIDRANPRGKFPESLDELLVLTGRQAFR
jgi:hypothetical protein